MMLVSVLMPVLNEEVYIERALGSVLAQTHTNLEILVIDGGSTDRTRALVNAFQDDRVRILENPGRWQVKALNIGLQAAQGDILVRLDGHAVIAPDYVERAVYHLTTKEVGSVGGLQRMVGETPMGKAIAVAYTSPFSVPSGFRTSQREMVVDELYLGAWHRDVFTRVGAWDERYRINEDYEHNYRIRKAGWHLLLVMDMVVYYYGRQSLGDLWRQYRHYGRGKVIMLKRNPASVRLRQVVAPCFVAALFGGGILAPFQRIIRLLWIVTLLLYSTVALAESLRLAKGNWRLLWRLPLAFCTMHVAWGLGFWEGLVRNE